LKVQWQNEKIDAQMGKTNSNAWASTFPSQQESIETPLETWHMQTGHDDYS